MPDTTPTSAVLTEERLIDLIIRDVCELPGDTDPNHPDALALTVSELQGILEHHLSEQAQQVERLTNERDEAKAFLAQACSDVTEAENKSSTLEERVAAMEEAVTFANYLLNVIEGPFGWATCRGEHGMRLKDAPEYVVAYLKIRAALSPQPSPSDAVIDQPQINTSLIKD